jgi:hypothetical protein
MAVRPGLGEFTGGDAFLPDSGFEMVVVTHRVRQFRLEILQLLVPIVVQQPVKSLLIIWPGEVSSSGWRGGEVRELTHRMSTSKRGLAR